MYNRCGLLRPADQALQCGTCSECFDGLGGAAVEPTLWTEMLQSPASLLPSLSLRPACQGGGRRLLSRPALWAPPPAPPVKDPRSTACWAYRSTSRKSSEPMLPGPLGTVAGAASAAASPGSRGTAFGQAVAAGECLLLLQSQQLQQVVHVVSALPAFRLPRAAVSAAVRRSARRSAGSRVGSVAEHPVGGQRSQRGRGGCPRPALRNAPHEWRYISPHYPSRETWMSAV